MTIAPIQHQPYAHGGFMALAPAMLADPNAVAALSGYMPEVGHQALALHAAAKSRACMLLLENNPILAAYGASISPAVALEWDVWLSPHAPADLRCARLCHGNLPAGLLAMTQPGPALAERLLSQPLRGADVHKGLGPVAWLALYHAARVKFSGAVWPPLRVVLDIKSPWSTAADVRAFVAAVTALGVQVDGVGSFKFSQLTDLPHALHFLHGVDGVGLALHAGWMRPGAQVLFNGGDLLRGQPGARRVSREKLADLRRVREEGDLRLGLYVQETHADAQAIDAVTRCVNDAPELFRLGFAYGGTAGQAQVMGPGVGLSVQRPSVWAEHVRRQRLARAAKPACP